MMTEQQTTPILTDDEQAQLRAAIACGDFYVVRKGSEIADVFIRKQAIGDVAHCTLRLQRHVNLDYNHSNRPNHEHISWPEGTTASDFVRLNSGESYAPAAPQKDSYGVTIPRAPSYTTFSIADALGGKAAMTTALQDAPELTLKKDVAKQEVDRVTSAVSPNSQDTGSGLAVQPYTPPPTKIVFAVQADGHRLTTTNPFLTTGAADAAGGRSRAYRDAVGRGSPPSTTGSTTER